MEETTSKKFTLPNKTVKVKFINRKRGMANGSWVTKDHAITGGMLNNSTKKLCVPMMKNKMLANVLTNDEKEYLEGKEGLNMDLSVYSNKEFWKDRFVTLRKGINLLDLSNPIDYIDYKILLANKDFIAPTWEARNNKLTYWFAIVEDGEEKKADRKQFNYKKEAFKMYSELEDNSNILRGIVKTILKKPLARTTDIRFLQDQVEKIIDESPEKFVSLLKDSSYEMKLLVSDAEDAGVIVVQNKQYITADGIELCYEDEIASYSNAVKYLSDPLNQELVDIIKVKINKTK